MRTGAKAKEKQQSKGRGVEELEQTNHLVLNPRVQLPHNDMENWRRRKRRRIGKKKKKE